MSRKEVKDLCAMLPKGAELQHPVDNLMHPSTKYQTCIFDCDGVILNSNRIKTNAFFSAVQEYGDELAKSLVVYHREHGGYSRFKKFEHFFSAIAKIEPTEDRMAHALEKFARAVEQGLIDCELDSGLFSVVDCMPNATCLVVSGGAQVEIREVFKRRRLLDIFSGVYGSPDNKREILERQIAAGSIVVPGLFIGDSRFDYEVATEYGFDFVFVTHWTEFDGWKAFFSERPITIVDDLGDLAARFAKQTPEQ